MAKVEVYSSMWCPFCHRAKKLLKNKGVKFEEIDVDGSAAVRSAMSERAGGRHTVPQIFINDTHIGGYTDMASLDYNDSLDPLLES